jgi:hypothetical protein
MGTTNARIDRGESDGGAFVARNGTTRGMATRAPELRQPVTALSLGDLRRRIEALMLPDDPVITLILDRTAERRRATLHLLEADIVTPHINAGWVRDRGLGARHPAH